MSALIRHSLKKGVKGNRHWEKLMPYTLDELKTHLERLWEPEMTWENHTIDGWHIDHIIPVSSFEFNQVEDQGFKDCWALNNLMPRWATTDIAIMNGSNQIGNINKAAKF